MTADEMAAKKAHHWAEPRVDSTVVWTAAPRAEKWADHWDTHWAVVKAVRMAADWVDRKAVLRAALKAA